MKTQYMVYNPKSGQNIMVDTEQQAREIFLQYVAEFVQPYFHNVPYTIVDVDDAGIETTRPAGKTISDILIVESNPRSI